MTRLVSWNVNGIRAIVQKNFLESVQQMNPDILCLQETKAQPEQVQEALGFDFTDYMLYANSAERKGYSSTAILTKIEPLSVQLDLGIEEHDKEGRVITLEFNDYYLINVYTPNSKGDLSRLDYRQTWDAAFLDHMKRLEEKKPVIVCGDLNVVRRPIDLARPKANYDKSAGFTQREIDGIDAYVNNGFIDTFRFFHPEAEGKYSWWSYRGGARAKNVGWRIDYFLTSESLQPRLKDAFIAAEMLGSDHCPVGLDLE